MRNEILTSVYGYFHYKQKNDASLELIERIILEKDYRHIASVILEILKEINHPDSYQDEYYMYMEDREFAEAFITHLRSIMTFDDFNFDD
ncbi:TPA: hypothetical protein NJF65_002410 [Pseudomonas aeruginosa]|nr:hypothetical protein [Pseudomonas aeruginosa]